MRTWNTLTRASCLCSLAFAAIQPHEEKGEVQLLNQCQANLNEVDTNEYTKEADCGTQTNEENDRVLPANTPKSATVYFARHAKSMWNDETSKSILLKMHLEFKHGRIEKYEHLKDAVLAEEGLQSAITVRDQLKAKCESSQKAKEGKTDFTDDICFLVKGHPDRDMKTLFVTSNLRRAILTALILFKNRILLTNGAQGKIERILIHSALQEISKNTDSIPITPKDHIPHLKFAVSDEQGTCPFPQDVMKNLFALACDNADENNSAPQAQTRRDRIERFCEWMRNEVTKHGVENIVIVGHSIWLRQLFQKYTQPTSGILKYLGKMVGMYLEDKVASSLRILSNDGILKFTVNVDETTCTILRGETHIINGKISIRR